MTLLLNHVSYATTDFLNLNVDNVDICLLYQFLVLLIKTL